MAETRREAGGPAPAAPAAEGEALRWREVSPPPRPWSVPQQRRAVGGVWNWNWGGSWPALFRYDSLPLIARQGPAPPFRCGRQ